MIFTYKLFKSQFYFILIIFHLISLIIFLFITNIFSVIEFFFFVQFLPSYFVWFILLVLGFIYFLCLFLLLKYKIKLTLYYLLKFYKQDTSLKISPILLYDLKRSAYHPKENQNHSLEVQELLNKNNQYIWHFINEGLPMKCFKILKFYIHPSILVLLMGYIFLLVSSIYCNIEPFFIFNKNKSFLAEESAYILKPQNGSFFLGQEVNIQLEILNSQYRFIAFHYKVHSHKKNIYVNKDRYSTYQWKIDSLEKPMVIYATLKKGFRTYFTNEVYLKPIKASSFKEISFKVDPPAYTKLNSFTSTQNLVRIYPGTRIQADIWFNQKPNDKLFYNNIKEITSSHNNIFKHTIVFNNTPIKVSYNIISYLNESTQQIIKSPSYEFLPIKDEKPTVKINTLDKQFSKLYIPEKGIVSWNYTISDDFGFRKLALCIFSGSDLIDIQYIPIKKNQIFYHTKSSRFVYQDKVELNLLPYSTDSYKIQMLVKDNSLIKETTFKLFNQHKKSKHFVASLGQVAYSNPLEIELPKNKKAEQALLSEINQKTAERLENLENDYKTMEQEFNEILESMAYSTEEDSTVKIREWKEKQKELQDKIKNIKENIQNNIRPDSEVGKQDKEEIVENLRQLDKDIVEKQKQLSKLLQQLVGESNKSLQLEQLKSVKKALNKKDYLKGLENSIQKLTNLLYFQTLIQLQKQLDQHLKSVKNLSFKITYIDNPNFASLQSETQPYKEITTGMQNKLKHLEVNWPIFKKDNVISLSNEHKKALEKNEDLLLNVKSLIELLQINDIYISKLNAWNLNLKKIIRYLSQKGLDESIKIFQKVAFEVNRISSIFAGKFNKQIGNQKYIKDHLAQDLFLIENSFNKKIQFMEQKLANQGAISPMIYSKINGVTSHFHTFRESIQENLVYSINANKKRLSFLLNNLSLLLLKETTKKKQRLSLIQQATEQKNIQRVEQEQKRLSKKMEKLSKKRSQEEASKEGQLSNIEKEYLKTLHKEQKAISKDLAEGINKDSAPEHKKKIGALLKKIEKIEKQISSVENKQDLTRVSKNIREISKKFLDIETKKSLNKQQKTESKKREAEKPVRKYVIPSKKVKIPQTDTKNITLEKIHTLSNSERAFYQKYIDIFKSIE